MPAVMTSAHNRKKQPELVRRLLLDCAAKLAIEGGFSAVTVQAVADGAGVTKGGLFHHFPSKQALIDAVVQDLMVQIDAEIDQAMDQDKQDYGCFTRAYIELTFTDRHYGIGSPHVGKAQALMVDREFNRMWSVWLTGRLRRHAETDADPMLEIVRLAADGAWMTRVICDDHEIFQDVEALRRRLVGLTRRP
ncbi:MAG: TetR/AcrR family transcriptional regulator [Telmatospirillum sp.]|nr:TetR/AcrR family transcriptional regulator [Telmatospirillum sp.]